MDALTLRGFFRIALPVELACLALLVVGGLGGWLRLDEIFLLSIGSALLGFGVAGVCYLIQYAKEMQSLHLPDEELQPSESILLESPHGVVHCRTGSLFKFWDAVGGKLVLTSQRLIFLAHRGQPWVYRRLIPLKAIARVEGSESLPGLPGQMCVTTIEGARELFTFGAIRRAESESWAAAILRLHYQLNPEN